MDGLLNRRTSKSLAFLLARLLGFGLSFTLMEAPFFQRIPTGGFFSVLWCLGLNSTGSNAFASDLGGSYSSQRCSLRVVVVRPNQPLLDLSLAEYFNRSDHLAGIGFME